MIINIKDTLTLDDGNQYVVVSKVNYDNKNYYYLLNKDDLKDVKFCFEDNDELVEISDKDLIIKLLPLFVESSQKEIDN